MKLVIAVAALICSPCYADAPDNLLTQVVDFRLGFKPISLDGTVWRDRANNIWLKSISASPQNILWINLSNIDVSGDIRTLMVIGDHRRNKTVGYRYSLRRQQINCRSLSTKVQRQDFFWADGAIAGVPADQRWKRIAVASPEEGWVSAVCN